MTTPLFKDLYKPHKDFHTKSYETGAHKLEIRGPADAELNFPADGFFERPDATLKVTNIHDSLVSAKVKASAKGLEITTERKKDGFTISDLVTFATAGGLGSVTLTGHYEAPKYTASAELTVKDKKSLSVAGVATLTPQLIVGAKATVPLADCKPTFDVGFRALLDQFALAGMSDLKTATIGALYNGFGLETKVDLATLEPTLGLGYQMKSLKARVEYPTYRANISVADICWKNVTVTLSAEGNLATLSGAKYGVTFNVKTAC